MKYPINKSNTGIYIALGIMLLWWVNLLVGINIPFSWTSPLCWGLFLIQIHLYTGLFITAHDAMHGTLAPRHPKLNHALGKIATMMYAFFPYNKLHEEHHKHHSHVHSNDDPDYYEGNFFVWYVQFVKHYLTIWQFVAFAVSFNILKLFLPTENLIFFWLVPSVISTVQLFYFGTYLPHKGEHNNHYHSRSQKSNHLWAFMSCYFFGYHYEHHEAPYVPWWQLWKAKEINVAQQQEKNN